MKDLLNILLAPVRGLTIGQLAIVLWWAISLLLIGGESDSLYFVGFAALNFIVATALLLRFVKLDDND